MSTHRNACAGCPFRKSATMAYDQDAAEWLGKGETPRCHELVGTDAIFHEEPTDATICIGHERWLDGHPAYQHPRILSKDTKR
jgi:hypothetical protein